MKRIVLVYGGSSTESEISILTALKTYKELMKTKDFLYCKSRADIPMDYMGYVYIVEMNSIFYYDNFIYWGESIVDVRGGQYLIKDLLKENT